MLAIKQDPAKKEAANELLKYTDTFTKSSFIGLTKPEPEVAQEAGKNNVSSSYLLFFNKISYLQQNMESLFINDINTLPIMAGPALDYLEKALGKFADGPFFLGEFSLVRHAISILCLCFSFDLVFCVSK